MGLVGAPVHFPAIGSGQYETAAVKIVMMVT
jgi:hypothetical protein